MNDADRNVGKLQTPSESILVSDNLRWNLRISKTLHRRKEPFILKTWDGLIRHSNGLFAWLIITFPTVHQTSEKNIISSKSKNLRETLPLSGSTAQMSTMSSSAERWSSEATSSSLELCISLSRCFRRSVTDVPVVSDNCNCSLVLSFYLNKKEPKNSLGISINPNIFSLKAVYLAHVRNFIWGLLGSADPPLGMYHTSFQPLLAHTHTAGITYTQNVSLQIASSTASVRHFYKISLPRAMSYSIVCPVIV